MSAHGRFHKVDSFTESDLEVLEQVEDLLWPLVEAYFKDGDQDGTKGIYRSETQVMTALPDSTNQAWHWDNKARGLTIIVPLSDFTAANGATQVLVGSHEKKWPMVAGEGAQVVQAPVGSIAAFDSRIYHRGLGNRTDEARHNLIFCYDRSWSPPPGCGPMGSLANAYFAAILNVVSAGWITCTSSSQIAAPSQMTTVPKAAAPAAPATPSAAPTASKLNLDGQGREPLQLRLDALRKREKQMGLSSDAVADVRAEKLLLKKAIQQLGSR
jgi:hypothetical protein